MRKKFNEAWDYFLGNYRYSIRGTKLQFLIRGHIEDQITMRINSMDNKCYIDGECKLCGCLTTALQMANKPCDGDCYPKMLSSKKLLKLMCEGVDLKVWYIKDSKFVRYEMGK